MNPQNVGMAIVVGTKMKTLAQKIVPMEDVPLAILLIASPGMTPVVRNHGLGTVMGIVKTIIVVIFVVIFPAMLVMVEIVIVMNQPVRNKG